MADTDRLEEAFKRIADATRETYNRYMKEIQATPGAWEMLSVYTHSVRENQNEMVCIEDLHKFGPVNSGSSYCSANTPTTVKNILSALDYWGVNGFVLSDDYNDLLDYLDLFRRCGWKLDGMQQVKTELYTKPGVVLVRGVNEEREEKMVPDKYIVPTLTWEEAK